MPIASNSGVIHSALLFFIPYLAIPEAEPRVLLDVLRDIIRISAIGKSINNDDVAARVVIHKL
jgi:hypothetical protein